MSYQQDDSNPVESALMTREQNLPDDILRLLKCSFCEEYLSYSPIMVHAESGFVCGRCPELEAELDRQPQRVRIYELVASLFKFPCRYRVHGCADTVPMYQMPEHELRCTYRQYFCPVLPLGQCPWVGPSTELHMHFATEHSTMLLENKKFEVDIVNRYSENFLLLFDDHLFLVFNSLLDDSGMLQMCVSLISSNDLTNYCYQLVFSGQSESCVILPTSKYIVDYENAKENICYIDLAELKRTLKEPANITCHVEVKLTSEPPQHITVTADEIQPPKFATSVNKLLLDLECPVCQDYMVSPIYQCVSGHSICSVCTPNLRECPFCRGAMSNTRNYTLEKLTENIEYNCRNHVDGCPFVDISTKTKEHELICEFNPHPCPLDCKWKGPFDAMFKHIKHTHLQNIQKDFFEMSIDLGENYEVNNIQEYMSELFKVRYRYTASDSLFSTTVIYLGRQSLARAFQYEAAAFDLTNSDLELKSKKFCGSPADEIDDFNHNTQWHAEMLKPFMANGKLKMRCRIMKARTPPTAVTI